MMLGRKLKCESEMVMWLSQNILGKLLFLAWYLFLHDQGGMVKLSDRIKD